jgi:hypothetical protein
MLLQRLDVIGIILILIYFLYRKIQFYEMLFPVEVMPSIYTCITTPDESPLAYFYDDAPTREWEQAGSASTSAGIPV